MPALPWPTRRRVRSSRSWRSGRERGWRARPRPYPRRHRERFRSAAVLRAARAGRSKLRHKSPACELLSRPRERQRVDGLRGRRRTWRPPRVSVRRKGLQRPSLQCADESRPASAHYYHAGTLRCSVVSELLVRRAFWFIEERAAQGKTQMFEHAVLENSFGNRRAFAASAGFAGQAALAACIAIAPLIWPQVLPSPRLTMRIEPPPPAPAPPEHTAAVRPRTAHSMAPMFRADLLLPARMPAHPSVIVDKTTSDP